ncbi:hypothetical protein A2U01_0074472, partial [Trifolium medium]|nr:hypothetical protein [Trifolium medium]
MSEKNLADCHVPGHR